MYGIIAHQGSSDVLFLRSCEIARSFGGLVSVVLSTDSHRLAIVGSGYSVASGPQSVFFGSGSQRLSEQSRSAQTFLDGAPDDVVGATVADGRLVLGAGRGNHRMFIFDSGHELLASSSLAVVAKASTAVIDRSLEDFLLGFSFLPIPHTPFAGIHALSPGSRWREGSVEAIQSAQQVSIDIPGTISQALPELRKRFEESLEDISGGEKSHAVLLGGFDSMLVAASLKRMGRDVHTYTFSFGDPKFEQRHVREFVGQYGLTHHWVDINPDVIAENLRTFGTWFFQPGALAHYQIHTLVATQQVARDGFQRVFNGDGCDALFLSFPTVNQRAAITGRIGRLPMWTMKPIGNMLRSEMAERRLGHVARTARSLLGNFSLELPARGHLPNRYLDDFALSLLRVGPAPQQAESVENIRYRLAIDLVGQSDTRRAFHGNGITGQSKVKVDGAVANTGIPHFTPYTHPHFRGYVSALPIDFLKNQSSAAGANGKEVLVAMAREYQLLPEFIINQPKQSPSDSPVDSWYQGVLYREVFNQLKSLPFEWSTDYISTVLKPKAAEEWYREKVASNHHVMQVIGLLMSYASFNRVISQ